MAIREGLFDSTTITTSPSGYPQGDKAETADFFADIIYRILGDGVSLVPTSAMNVVTNTGMTVTVKAGVAFKRGYKAQLESDLDIPFTTSASEQIFYVGVRLDEASGEFAGHNVVARTAFVAESDMAFAKITIPANAVVITDAMIEDLRYNSTYCGFVDTYRISLANIYDEFVDALAVAVAGGIPAHATSHATGGSDVLTPAAIGAAALDANDKVSADEASSYINAQSDSYTLALTDAGKLVKITKATACNLTIPLYSSVAFPVGTEIEIVQYGAGTVTIVATSGVTLYSAGSATDIAAQYASVALKCIAQDEWLLVGYLA